MPTFVLRGRGAIAYAAATSLGLAVVMVLTRPDLGPELPGAVVVTGLSILVATRVGVTYVRDLAAAVDADAARADAEQREVLARRAAGRAAAEDARLVHDTVINTLAAIASGGRALADPEVVRERCRRDIEAVRSVRGETADDPGVDAGLDPGDGPSGLRDLPPVPGIRVVHRGLDEEQLAAAEGLLGEEQWRVLRLGATELVQNAARHSGADDVEVHVAVEQVAAGESVVVTVSDTGVGFDGVVRPDGGLHRSVLQRSRDAGIAVDVRTAEGRGTTVRLSVPAARAGRRRDDGPPRARDGRAAAAAVRRLVRQAGFLMAAGLCLVGVVLALANHPGELTPEYAMVAVTAVAAYVAWRTGRDEGPDDGPLRPAVAVLLAAAAPVAFVLSALAVGLGRDEPVLWQVVAPVGPLLLLLVLAPTPRPAVVACAVYGATGVGVSAAVAGSSSRAAAVVLVAAVVGLGLVLAWSRFMATSSALGVRAAAARGRLVAAQDELAARTATDQARERWRAAGLASSLRLLDSIGHGDADLDDPALRAACAREEEHLRQVTLLHPELVRLGPWVARALGVARTRDVHLRVRTSEADVESAATTWGRAVLSVVERVPAGAEVTAGVFPSPAGTRMVLVGPAPHLDHAAALLAAERSLVSVATLPGDGTTVVEALAGYDAGADVREADLVAG
jgi:hypothetical protein